MRKLPVFAALGHVAKSAIHNIGFAFQISWPWMIPVLLVNLSGNIYFSIYGNPDPLQNMSPVVMFTLATVLMTIIAYASIAVNWHRYILLDEVATGWSRLRIDKLTWRYIGNIIGIFLLMLIAVLVVMIPAGLFFLTQVGPLFFVGALIYLVGIVFISVSSYRLSVKLPSIALGRTDFRLRDAWDSTRDNFWQLLGLFFLFGLIVITFFGVTIGLTVTATASGGTLLLSILVAIELLVNWLTTILGVTLLTSLYGFFVEGRDF